MFAYLAKCTGLGFVAGASIALVRQELNKDPVDRNYYTLAAGAVVAIGSIVTTSVIIVNKFKESSE